MIKLRPTVLLMALLALLFVNARSSRADTIYNNLGPGNTWIVNREYDVNSDFMATLFVTSSGGNLATVITPLFSLNNPVTVDLYTNSAGQPGTLVEAWSVSAPGFPGQLTTLTSVLNPLLSANTRYWLVIPVTDIQKLNLAWYQNNQGLDGGIWIGNNLDALIQAEPASPMPAIQLNSTSSSPVPEPCTMLLFCSGLVGLAAYRRFKKA